MAQRAKSVTSEVTGVEKSHASSEPSAYQPAKDLLARVGSAGSSAQVPHTTSAVCMTGLPPLPLKRTV